MRKAAEVAASQRRRAGNWQLATLPAGPVTYSHRATTTDCPEHRKLFQSRSGSAGASPSQSVRPDLSTGCRRSTPQGLVRAHLCRGFLLMRHSEKAVRIRSNRESENVRECPEMSCEKMRILKTNPPPQRELSPRQQAAARLLVAGKSTCAAARMLGVNPRTIYRWRQNPTFRAGITSCVADVSPLERSRNAAARAAQLQASILLPRPTPKPGRIDPTMDAEEEADLARMWEQLQAVNRQVDAE